MTRLNVVSGGDDVEMSAIRATIRTFDVVVGLEDLIAVLDGHCKRGERAEILDAIGHSRSPGFLVIGAWHIDDSPQTAASFSELLCPSLRRLGVRTIRLLGCSTAVSERGRSAMRRIARATECYVLGTSRIISRHDYSSSGFISDETLVDADRSRFAGVAR